MIKLSKKHKNESWEKYPDGDPSCAKRNSCPIVEFKDMTSYVCVGCHCPDYDPMMTQVNKLYDWIIPDRNYGPITTNREYLINRLLNGTDLIGIFIPPGISPERQRLFLSDTILRRGIGQ